MFCYLVFVVLRFDGVILTVVSTSVWLIIVVVGVFRMVLPLVVVTAMLLVAVFYFSTLFSVVAFLFSSASIT